MMETAHSIKRGATGVLVAAAAALLGVICGQRFVGARFALNTAMAAAPIVYENEKGERVTAYSWDAGDTYKALHADNVRLEKKLEAMKEEIAKLQEGTAKLRQMISGEP